MQMIHADDTCRRYMQTIHVDNTCGHLYNAIRIMQYVQLPTKRNWSAWCQYNVTGWGSSTSIMWAYDMLSQ